MKERFKFERELTDLDLREYFWSVPGLPQPATVGFEFDVHFGLMKEVVDHAGKTMPANNAEVTKHAEDKDFFRVKRDGPRLEISTKPFSVDDEGKKELDQAIINILKFAGELEAECKAPELNITIPGVVKGKPRPFTRADTIIPGLPIVRLPFDGKFVSTDCRVWASPQATVTVTLSKVAALVEEIKKSEGKGAGRALTGSGNVRMGLRSDAIYRAYWAVNRLWKELASMKPRLVLSDMTEVNARTLSDDLRGLLILLVSYLWTGELKYNYPPPKGWDKDYERYAKAYLPINVKASFSDIFLQLLNNTEKLMFKEVFAAKGPARDRLFRLARPRDTNPDGSRKLFPTGPKIGTEDSVHKFQAIDFTSVPTWDDLIDHTINSPHKGWGYRLIVPSYSSGPKPTDDSSKIIPLNRTRPRVALELRRIGFAPVFSNRWAGLMRQVFDMTKRLDR